jgi:hypothetical protein
VASVQWLEATVWDYPGLKFKSADVRKIRVKSVTLVRPKKEGLRVRGAALQLRDVKEGSEVFTLRDIEARRFWGNLG